MDTLLCLHRTKQNKLQAAACIVSAFALALSSLLVLVRQFGIPWGFDGLFSGDPAGGFIYAWNSARDTLGNTNYVLLKHAAGEGEGCGLFLFLVLIILAVAAYFIIRGRFTPMLLIYFVPQILIGLIFSLHAETPYAAFLCVSVIAAVIVIRMEGGLVQMIAGAAFAFFAVLLLSLVLDTFGKGLESDKDPGTEHTVITSIADSLYGTDPLNHGDLTRTKRETGDGTALEVKMSVPQAMYLKGFTGSRFAGTGWRDLGDSTYYGYVELMRALEAEGFNAPGQLAQAASVAGVESAPNVITVKNVGADRRIAYVPYDITEKGDLEERLTKGGSIFYHGKFAGFDEYTYTAAENQVDNWTDDAGMLFQAAVGTAGEESDSETGSGLQEDPAGNSGQNTEQDEQSGEDAGGDKASQLTASDYLGLESYYNSFVYASYTYLSASERKILAENIGSAGDQSRGHVDYKNAITAIRTYLEDNFIYTENIGERTSDNGLREFFTSHKGSDVDFATAATEMFRYYGIPARYAEGYLITPEDVEGVSSEETIEVGRDRAHAWTEIYIDGVGFVPLEVTPEYYGVMPEADLTKGISNEALMQQKKDQEQNQNEEEEQEEEEEKEREKDGEFLPMLLIILGLLAIAAAAFFVIRWLIRLISKAAARKRLFYQAEPKTAVAGIYGYMEEKELPCTDEAVELGNRAAYSQEKITEEERARMLSLLKEAEENKRKEK